MSEALTEKTKNLPAQPGVYLFKNRSGTIVYIGKAVNLRSRVRSYFTRSGDTRTVTRFIERVVTDVDFIVTDNEKEALILEDALVKEHQPKYNVELKDDKSFLSIKVDMDRKFPRLDVLRVRKTHKAKEKYFGPFHSAHAARAVVKLLTKTFGIRRCSDAVFNNRTRPCLDYQIKICPGPCCDLIGEADYKANVERAVLMLKGQDRELIGELKARMQEASEALLYEEAAKVRDQIRAIEATVEKQKVVSLKRVDRDVFGYHATGGEFAVQALYVRNGILTGSKEFFFPDHGLEPTEVIASFVLRFYSVSDVVPHQVLLPVPIEAAEALAEWLAEKRGANVEILTPQRGDNLKLVRLAGKNAALRLDERIRSKVEGSATLAAVQTKLKLDRPPVRIECYDISHTGGADTVGSLVTFVDGEPDKNGYRKYKIRSAAAGDDYGAMYEVMQRRWKRLLEAEEGASGATTERPDLVLVDGSKGQLAVAVAVLHDLGVEGVAIAAIAKAGDHTVSKAVETDEVFLPGRKNPVRLRSGSPELFLLQRIRDESHRFAITYQRKLRSKTTEDSILDAIPGIGRARRVALLREFGSVAAIAKTDAGQIAAVKGMNPDLAQKVIEKLAESGS